MFMSRRHLSRRTVLRGAGVSLALPLLDAMIPALTADEKTALREMKCATQDEANETARDLHGRT